MLFSLYFPRRILRCWFIIPFLLLGKQLDIIREDMEVLETLCIFGRKYPKQYFEENNKIFKVHTWSLEEKERKESRQEGKHSFDREIKYYLEGNIKLPSVELCWGTSLRFFSLDSIGICDEHWAP